MIHMVSRAVRLSQDQNRILVDSGACFTIVQLSWLWKAEVGSKTWALPSSSQSMWSWILAVPGRSWTWLLCGHVGFPGGSAGKESACNAGDLGSIPGLRRSPGEGNGYPLQYFIFNWRITTLQYCNGSCHTSAWISHKYMCPPILNPLLPLSTSYLSRLSQSIGFGCPASCIELTLVIHFTYSNVCVSMLFSQIFPHSPSPTESKSLFFTSVSPLLPCM